MTADLARRIWTPACSPSHTRLAQAGGEASTETLQLSIDIIGTVALALTMHAQPHVLGEMDDKVSSSALIMLVCEASSRLETLGDLFSASHRSDSCPLVNQSLAP